MLMIVNQRDERTWKVRAEMLMNLTKKKRKEEKHMGAGGDSARHTAHRWHWNLSGLVKGDRQVSSRKYFILLKKTNLIKNFY